MKRHVKKSAKRVPRKPKPKKAKTTVLKKQRRFLRKPKQRKPKAILLKKQKALRKTRQKKPKSVFSSKAAKTLRGIVAVVFFEFEGKRKFLVLRRILNWIGWELLKGSLDEGERPEDALAREIFEEACLTKILLAKKLPIALKFFDPIRKCKREMQGFLVQVDANEKVDLGTNEVQEHSAFEWVDEKTALEKLTYAEQKNVFKAALKELKRA